MKSNFEKRKLQNVVYYNNPKIHKMVERQIYQDYLRKSSTPTEKRFVKYTRLEEVFTNEIYFQAMKKLTPTEKKILYLTYYENLPLNSVCKRLKCTKSQAISMKESALRRFKENVGKYQKFFFNNGGDFDA